MAIHKIWLQFIKVDSIDIGSKNFAVIVSISDDHIPVQKVFKNHFKVRKVSKSV